MKTSRLNRHKTLFANNMTISVVSVENSMGSTNKQVEVIQEFNKAVEYNTQK